ncbi:hypothetical protein [Aureimonas sp. N4]|uniref:hypothetical protein n=1 Tax=Aureimonas sp. N4 TaxID=1638165 RepID=UPI0007804225|nr:hypothetical protein [Aureimonas sp. N4]
MTTGQELAGVMRFIDRPEWGSLFEEVLTEHMGSALDTLRLDYDDLETALGPDLGTALWDCAFEDFLTREMGEDGRNLADTYLKKRGWKESPRAKAYIAGIRTSRMGLYELSEVVPGESFFARDCLARGEPVQVFQRGAELPMPLQSGDRIAARLVRLNDRLVLASGLLPCRDEVAARIQDRFAEPDTASDRAQATPTQEHPKDDSPDALAPFITHVWLLDMLPRVIDQLRTARNTDGEEPLLHEFRYPLAPGARMSEIAARLNAAEGLTPLRPKVWGSLATVPDTATPLEISTEIDAGKGRIALVQIALEERVVVLLSQSAARAEQGAARLEEALGEVLLAPTIQIERHYAGLGDIEGLSPEDLTGRVHGFLTGYYRRALDRPVAALGHQSPRAAAAGGDRKGELADWLKGLEAHSAKAHDPKQAAAAFDFGWLRHELGLDAPKG